MSFTIQNAQDELAGIVHGKTVNKITSINGAARRAAANVLSQIDPAETRRYVNITVYDGVQSYALPMTDLKENRIFDIRPQVNRHKSDNLSSRMSKELDLKKLDNWFTIEDDSGTKYFKTTKRLTPGRAAIDPLDSTTGWAASGDASGLAQDTLYTQGDGDSLKFNLNASGTAGLITKAALPAIDISNGQDVGAFFLWVYLPTLSTNITGVKLRVGTGAGAYWEMTGAIHFGSQQVGWNLFKFLWSGATKTGSPVSTAITYVRMEFDYGGTAVGGIRIDDLFMSIPRIWVIGYYSKFLFNNNGTWQETVTDGSTSINLDTMSFNIFVYEFGLEALQQIAGKDAAADRVSCREKLFGDGQNQRGLYAEYRKNNPTQTEKMTQTTYSNLSFRRK